MRGWTPVRSVHQELHNPVALTLQPFAQAMRLWASNSSEIITFWLYILERAENGETIEELQLIARTWGD